MAEPAREEPRYRAFLSYSHRDAADAARIHRRLESYRVPKRLVGWETERGPVPRRLCPIFRDREEFAASADLSEAVRAGLAQSGALIVLCSPAAAESRWVAQEIRTFRQLNHGAPVLAAIVAGEPPACFPEPLLAGPDGARAEPLATDLRREGDGRHLGLLKLVAGITGVPLDDLVQRDASRRIRRVTAVTAAALIAVLMMAALTLFALDARREAERQRAEAEGLIEFMLTDLRQELRSVGRLDVMSAVNERALSYYDRRPAPRDARADLAIRARVIHAIGEDMLTRGDTGGAFLKFREAYRATLELAGRSPSSPQSLFAHGQSQYWLGRVHTRREEWPQAFRYYTAYAETAERLVRIAPGNPDYMMEVGYGASNIGEVRLKRDRDPGAARSAFERSLDWFQQAERARPGNETAIREQADAHAWIADTFNAQRLRREALAARLRQLDTAERLHRSDPSSMEKRYQLALAQRAVGAQALILHDRQRGISSLTRAYENALLLRRHDPSNSDWQVLKAMIECMLLFYRVPRGDGLDTADLRREAAAAAEALRAQGNQHAQEITRCLNALSR
jgi:tetratricopeptide (TPR) repeat protein